MRATARRRERFEKILLAYVRALGPKLVLPPDVLARIREQVPDVSFEELGAAIKWSLQQSKHKGAALEAALRTEREASNVIQLNERIEQIERAADLKFPQPLPERT
jgi:predicted RNase H-like nuclease